MEIKQRGMARWRLCTVNDSHKQKEDDWHKDDCIQPTTNTKKRRQLAKRCMCTVSTTHTIKEMLIGTMTLASSQHLTQTKRRRLAQWRLCTLLTVQTVETHTNKQTNSRHLRHRKRRRLGEWRAIGLYTFTKWRLHPVNNSHKQTDKQRKRRLAKWPCTSTVHFHKQTAHNSHKQKEDD